MNSNLPSLKCNFWGIIYFNICVLTLYQKIDVEEKTI